LNLAKGGKKYMKGVQKQLKEALDDAGIKLDKNIAAHILDQAFHSANESFYELFEDGESYKGFSDQYEMQDAYLENLTIILQNLLAK